jgi:hypothetical protein
MFLWELFQLLARRVREFSGPTTSGNDKTVGEQSADTDSLCSQLQQSSDLAVTHHAAIANRWRSIYVIRGIVNKVCESARLRYSQDV